MRPTPADARGRPAWCFEITTWGVAERSSSTTCGSAALPRSGGQDEGDGGPLADDRGALDPTPVSLGHPHDEGQPEAESPEAAGVGAVTLNELGEGGPLLLLRHPLPLVAYGQADGGVVAGGGLEDDLAALGRELDRIVDQLVEGEPDPAAIAEDGWRAAGRLAHQRVGWRHLGRPPVHRLVEDHPGRHGLAVDLQPVAAG